MSRAIFTRLIYMQTTPSSHTPSSTITIAPDIQSIYDIIAERRQQLSRKRTMKTSVGGDELLAAIIQRWADHQSTMDLMRKLFGLPQEQDIATLYHDDYRYNYPKNYRDVLIGETSWRLSLPMADRVQQFLNTKPQVIDFFVLIYAVRGDLSDHFYTLCQERDITITKIISQVQYFAEHEGIVAMGGFVFLETICMMMEYTSLSLDTIDMIKITNIPDMQHMMSLIQWQKNTRLTLVDSVNDNYESDVLDHDQDANTVNNAKKTNKKDESKNKKKDEKKMAIEFYGTDLTDEAKNNRLDLVIGREKEIEQVIYTLLRKTKSNPLLIGEAWVGKTAIVEWIAQRIAVGNVPERLKNKRIMMVDVGSMVAGTKYRGDFEARFKAVMDEASDPTNNIILFIDEIHTIIGAGWAAGTDDAAQLLKPMLARGKIKLIAATTFDEYQQHIEKDAALKRRFQEIHVNEPSLEDTKKILLGLRPQYEEFHGVQISDESIDAAITLTQRYVLNKQFPDKAIDIIDEASARASTIAVVLDKDQEYLSISKALKVLQKNMEKAVEEQDYFAAADFKLEEQKLKDKLWTLRASKALPMHLRPAVSPDAIGRVLADKTWVPADVVTESEITKLQRLKSHLDGKILGQDEAVAAVVKTLQRSRLSVVERNKPIASFLFLGPSGVGKTYLAKLIAKEYFGDEKAMIRVDMSEFMESYTASKLIGSAPGYVGYESGGMLTEQVRRKPYCVVLLDEIEKANRDILNILLQIFDEGQIKDNKGRLISFKSTIIIMTSNLGAEEFGKKKASIGFSSDTDANDNRSDSDRKKITERVDEHVKDFLTPELQNRIDYKIVFKPLSKAILGDIFKHKLSDFLHIWQTKTGHTLDEYDDAKIASIIDEIYKPEFGARPIEKYIHDTIEPELIEKVMNG